MRTGTLLLVLLCLPALFLAQQSCSAGTTKDSGCSICATTAADSDCNYCKDGYWKSGAKACTACATGTGRNAASATTDIETAAICTIKSAPQLKCGIASDRYTCSTCATGSYVESGMQFGGEVYVNGCTTDCKSLGGETQLIPNTDTTAQTSCTSCSSSTGNCVKCAYSATLKRCAGVNQFCQAGASKQLTTCSQCANGYYLLPNKDEPTAVIPSCASCGANCKTCKDNTECSSCWPGWAFDGTDKANCLKSVPVSSSNILAAGIISILALFIAW